MSRLQEAATNRSHLHLPVVAEDAKRSRSLDHAGSRTTLRHKIDCDIPSEDICRYKITVVCVCVRVMLLSSIK